MRDLSSLTGDQAAPPALEGEVFTSGPPGKSLCMVFPPPLGHLFSTLVQSGALLKEKRGQMPPPAS